jgi:hypothetical protein
MFVVSVVNTVLALALVPKLRFSNPIGERDIYISGLVAKKRKMANCSVAVLFYDKFITAVSEALSCFRRM